MSEDTVHNTGSSKEDHTQDNSFNATDTLSQETVTPQEDTSEEPYIIGEEEGLRELTVKHFRLSDGSYQVADYGTPVHLKAEDGTWQDIDNTLVETARGYEPVASALDVVLPKDITDGRGVSLSDGKYPISWVYDVVPIQKRAVMAGGTHERAAASDETHEHAVQAGEAAERMRSTEGPGSAAAEIPDGAAAVSVELSDVVPICLARTGQQRQKLAGDERFTTLQSLTDEAVYRDIATGVGLEYVTLSHGIKESIVLEDGQAPGAYTITYRIGNLTAAQAGPQTIELKDAEGAIIWTIAAPVMADAAGEISDAVTLTLADEDEGSIKVRVSADEKWLADTERAYPVRIDPTIRSETLRQVITQGFTNTAGYGGGRNFTNGSMYVGRMAEYEVCHMYAKIDLPNIPPSSVIIKARFGLVQYRYQVSPDTMQMNVSAHQVLQYWDTSISPWAEPSRSGVLDYQRIFYDYTEKFVWWDITKAVSNWYRGASPNYGIVLKSVDENTYWRAQFYSSNYPYIPTEYYPLLVVNYRNQIGLESYWTAHTQDLGRSGTGHIKDMTQALTWVHPDIAFSAGANSIALSHVYNSNGRASYPTSSNPGFYAGRVGRDWSLSLLQRLAPNLDSGTKANYPYIYIDADGTEHYICGTTSVFTQDQKNKDEDGLGLAYSLANAGSNDYHRLTTKDGTVLKFDTAGNLRAVVDSNGNTTTLDYGACTNNKPRGGDNYLTSVSTDAGRVSLNYVDYHDGVSTVKRLTSLADTAGRQTTYHYTGDLLTSIVYPDATSTEFVYSGNRLKQVKGIDGSRIDYTQSAQAGYSGAREIAPDGTAGKGYTIAQTGYLQTAYTNVKDTSRKETYQFNTFGNTTGVYNQDGMALTQRFSNVTGWANNRLTGSASSGATVENKVLNPIFASALSGWGQGGTGTVSLSTTQRFSRAKTVKIASTAPTGSTRITQNGISLVAGKTYTLSAYFKAEGVAGQGAALEVVFDNNASLFSEYLTGDTNPDIMEGFQRVTATFTVPQGRTVNYIAAGLYQATGTVYVSGLQLEQGAAPSQLNLFFDSSFERGNGTAGPAHTGSCSKKLVGNYTTAQASYSIGVAGDAGDVYTFGGWAKGESVPEGIFRIAMKIVYADGTSRWEYANFNKHIEGWQYAMASFDTKDPAAPTKAYADLQLYLEYSSNANTAYFDDVFVYRDNAKSYTYDTKGNLVSATDAAASAMQFEYNNNLIAKVVNPSGTGYEYRYDTRKNLTSFVSAEGILHNLDFDGRGNPTSSELFAATQRTSAISEEKVYVIRNQATGRYLDILSGRPAASAPVVQQAYSGTGSQEFCLKAAGDGYYTISPAHALSWKVDVSGASAADGTALVLYTNNGSNAQRFKIIPNDDGSVRIATKVTGGASVLTVANGSVAPETRITQNASTSASHQRWYFEEVRDTRSDAPEAGAIYSLRVNHSGQYLTAEGASAAPGTKIVQSHYSGRRNQRFHLKDAGDGYYKLTPLYAPDMAVTLSATPYLQTIYFMLTLESDTGADTQLFKPGAAADGTYWFEVKSESGKAISLPSSSYASGTPFVCFPYGGGFNEQLIVERASRSFTSSAAYDPSGSFLTQTTDSLGNTTDFFYLADRGLLEGSASTPGEGTWRSYDKDNDRLIELRQEHTRIGYEYTDAGLPSRILMGGRNFNGFSYDLSYDGFGNRVTTSAAGQVLVTNTYEAANGNLISSAYGNGASISMAYDSYDRVTARQWDGLSPSTITYDGKGNVYSTTDGLTGITTTFGYDLIGRLLLSRSSDGLMQWMGYDERGRTCSSSYSLEEGADTYKTTYLYGDVPSGEHKSMLYGLSRDGIQKLGYAYDSLCRLTRRSIADDLGYTTTYRYVDNPDTTTTTLLAGMRNGEDAETTYEYDRKGRVTHVYEGGALTRLYSYTYDRLSAEYDPISSEATFYTYDVLGNLDCTEACVMTEVWVKGPALRGSCYYYDPIRKDELIGIESIIYDECGGHTASDYRSFTYDEIGNPLTYADKTMRWGFGRRLMGIAHAGVPEATYAYNDAGIRTAKTVGNTTTTYTLSGTKILRQEDGTDSLDFFYDEAGDLYGLLHDGTEYWYIRNGLDDITGIVDGSGAKVVSYAYGTWGEPLSVTGTLADTLGELNPFRYRGYYYDTETGFYYLNSRYYDPAVRRFINADGLVSTGQGVSGYNMYAYCTNDPVSRVDPGGCAGKAGWAVTKAARKAIAKAAAPVAQTAGKSSGYYIPAKASTANSWSSPAEARGHSNADKFNMAISGISFVFDFVAEAKGMLAGIPLDDLAKRFFKIVKIVPYVGDGLSIVNNFVVNWDAGADVLENIWNGAMASRWDATTAFIGSIPYIGPFLSIGFDIANYNSGGILEDLFHYQLDCRPDIFLLHIKIRASFRVFV